MENPQSVPPHPEANETAVSLEDQTQALMEEILERLESGEYDAAIASFQQLRPADQGDVLLDSGEESRQELLTLLTPDQTAEIFEDLDPEEVVDVSEGLSPATLAEILDEASPDVAADILRQLPQGQARDTLESMEEAGAVIPLLQYTDDSAGGLMIPDFLAIRESITAGNALDELRLLGDDAYDVSVILVVDDNGRLAGFLNVTRLALARPATLVSELKTEELLSVTPDTDQAECARLMQRYDLGQLPVVDPDGRLLGVILTEDIVDVVEEEATEDMYKIAAVAGERVLGPLRGSLRNRLPWLYLNLATAFLAAGVISFFESTIARVVVLAAFLPVVAGQGGIAGTQTVTLVVRSMSLGEIPASQGMRVLARELSLGVINGVLLGVVVGLIGYGWKANPMLGVVLALAMLGNMIVAGFAGAGVPLLLRRLGLDPAVSSAVFVTTFTDVLGFLMFLGLAAIFVDFLV